MPYSIDRYSGGDPIVVEDGTIDSTFDIKLIGKNYAGYGEVQNENFVHLLENFAGGSAPSKKTTGQIWFDSSVSKLKFYDGANWRTTGGAEVGGSEPSGLSTGDFWFDTDNKQLYAWDGSAFVLIGPESAPGLGTTQLKSVTVLDEYAGEHAVIQAIIDDVVVFVMSVDEFTLDSGVNPIIGFNTIKKGITLINTGTTGTTSSDHRLWGTASHSLKASQLLVDGSYLSATAAATSLTVASRDSSGDLYANVFQGEASSARYADLAEKYLADKDYEPGTVVSVCEHEDHEVEACQWGQRAIGVVSTNPAFMMNKDLEGGTYIALKGRVPCKVVGAVKKGQRLIAGNDGAAVAAVPHANDVFAIALESSADVGIKTVEVLVL